MPLSCWDFREPGDKEAAIRQVEKLGPQGCVMVLVRKNKTIDIVFGPHGFNIDAVTAREIAQGLTEAADIAEGKE